MKTISAERKRDVVALLSSGKSIRDVGHQLKLSKSVVGRVRKACLPSGSVIKPGRPQKLSPADKRFCIHAVTTGRVETAKAVARQLFSDLNVEVSAQTVRRTLFEAGLASFEKVAKPHLSRTNVQKRLAFAKRHKDWTVEDWKRVVWSDESKINRFCSDGRKWCWVRGTDQIQDKQVKGTVKHGGGSVMVWGCLTAYGPGFLCKIDGTMDQTLYKEILEGELEQTFDYYHLKKDKLIFQQDNDPKHTANSIKTWFKEQEFSVLEWPPQSPDMNPIEHVWALVKRRLNDYDEPPSGILDLWERVQDIWNQITPNECLAYVSSMPNRIQALLKAKGRWTSY